MKNRKKLKEVFVYIIECADDGYFIDCSPYVRLSVFRHQIGEGGKATEQRLPVRLVYTECYRSSELAIERVRQLNQWDQAKLRLLVSGALRNKIQRIA